MLVSWSQTRYALPYLVPPLFMREQNFLCSHSLLYSNPAVKRKHSDNALITCCKNLMVAWELEFPIRHTIPETTELLWLNMPDFWFLAPTLKSRQYFDKIMYHHWLHILPFADLYLLQFGEKQVDIVHRIYLPDKGFYVFQKNLKWTRVLPLLFWALRTCTSSTKINSEILSGSTGWRKS